MNNEPVAIRYDFDGYGYQYMDSGSGSDWQTRVKGEPLYTHPVKELTDGEIAKKNTDAFITITKKKWLDKLNEEFKNGIKYSCKRANLKETLDTLFENTHPVKELTDEEIDAVGDEVSNLIDTYAGRREFARAILRKAQEK